MNAASAAIAPMQSDRLASRGKGVEVMRIRTAVLVTIVSVLCAPGLALARDAPPVPPQKTIGQPGKSRDLVSSLIVMNSRDATLEGDKLTLTGVTPNSIIFSDRPVRLAGHELTAQLIGEWVTPGSASFSKDPPNATVSAFSKDGATVKDAVVVLKAPKLEGDNLTFAVQVFEGELTGADGPASPFIDIFGVWRRAAFRGAMYAGAAAGAAAACGAYGAPYYRPACGYYPYPPCY
jgi:hypothetical protein